MAISYSGIIGYGKYNLPSIESWGTNNNILKDPPRSITTRRRDKVGLNSTITQNVEMSRDRVAEAIKAYPRGVNPMVGVSYNGQGNAGIHSGQALLTRGQQAKLPYRVAMDGAFRPPVLAPVDLLPLSRMPRLVTKVDCAVNNPDFQKKLSCSAEKNTYKHKLLNTSCGTKKTYNIKKPSELMDRRHINTRKNVLPADITINRSIPSNGDRGNANCAITTKTLLNANALNLNHQKKKQVAGQISGGADISRHVGRTLIGDINIPYSGMRKEQTAALGAMDYSRMVVQPLRVGTIAPMSGYRKEAEAPIVVSSCREESFRTQMHPVSVIKRESELDRPEYTRAFGRKGILVPDGGVYNARGLPGV